MHDLFTPAFSADGRLVAVARLRQRPPVRLQRRSVVVSSCAPSPGRVTVTLRRGGRRIARQAVRAATGGMVAVRPRRPSGARPGELSVRARFSPGSPRGRIDRSPRPARATRAGERAPGVLLEERRPRLAPVVGGCPAGETGQGRRDRGGRSRSGSSGSRLRRVCSHCWLRGWSPRRSLSRAESLNVTLTGFEEVVPVSSAGSATFSAQVAGDGNSISWTLSYKGPAGCRRPTSTSASSGSTADRDVPVREHRHAAGWHPRLPGAAGDDLRNDRRRRHRRSRRSGHRRR